MEKKSYNDIEEEALLIAVIPARIGSKGLPRKNILNLCGIPLIHHTIKSALNSKLIKRIIISTDSKEIIEKCKSFKKVEIPFLRPKELSTDNSSAIDVYLHLVEWFKNKHKLNIKEMCVLLPTAPIRSSFDIDNAIKLFFEKKADSVLSVQKAKPLEWHLNYDDKAQIKTALKIDLKKAISNRQNLQKTVVLNGSIYVLNTEFLKKNKTYFGKLTFGYLMPAFKSIDIDTEDDLKMAEAIINSGIDA